MSKIKIIALTVVSICLISLIIWFLNQNVSEGYVYSNNNKSLSILVISLEDSEVEGKTQEEITAMLDAKVSNKGSIYDIPYVNRVLKTQFTKGQKVKIYWNGPVLTSAPSQIKGTVLITNIK